MNSRYMRPAPQQARIPQPQRMQPMQWPTMNVPPPPQIAQQQGPDPLMAGLTQLGTAAVNRGEDDEPEAPPVAMPAVATPVAEPAIPIAPPPAFGAPPVDPMQKKKPSILESLFSGMA